MALFTVDLEGWNHALHTSNNGHTSIREVDYLIDVLREYNVKAIFYVLGRFAHEYPEIRRKLRNNGHILGNHGMFHDHGESLEDPLFRSPYWDKTKIPFPPSGGFFFRFMPYSYVKWAVEKSGVFWIHPHDLDEDHPCISNPILNWKRHIGIKSSKQKLEKLLKEISWEEASQKVRN